MAKFALVVAICATAICIGQISAQSAEDMDKGLDVSTKAAQGMCWYEFLKIKPDKNPKTKKFGGCYQNLSTKNLMKQFEAQNVKKSDYAMIKGSLGPNFGTFVKQFAPAQYTNCQEYLDDPMKEYKQDYSEVLGDQPGSYPYRGWAHCVMGKLEETHGKDALNAMKDKYNNPHPWINEVFDRENENRARHGVPPVKLNDELNSRAQKWADQLAAKCGALTVADHIQKDNPEATYEGKQCGENIAQNSALPPEEDSAMAAANAWYEEIRDYPWPEYKGKGDDAMFGKIGHFTASVWKGVEQVGYGLGRREGCDKTYVVGRYWPAGNMVGKFGENVMPPKA